MRHVIQAADPFIVPVTHQGADRAHGVHEPLRTITAANRGELMLAMPELAPFITEHANASTQRTMDAGEPLRTMCAKVKGGHFSVVTPILAGVGGRAGQSEPRSGADPLYTMTAKADTALVAPVLVQTGYGERAGQAPRALDLQQPLGTIVAGGVKHAVAAPHLVKFRGDSIGTPMTDPVPTITSGAGAARPAGAAHALGMAAASLVTLRRNMVGADARTPLTTIAAQAEHHALSTPSWCKPHTAKAAREVSSAGAPAARMHAIRLARSPQAETGVMPLPRQSWQSFRRSTRRVRCGWPLS